MAQVVSTFTVKVISYLSETNTSETKRNLKNLLLSTTSICGIKGPPLLSSKLLSGRDMLVDMNYISYTGDNFELITFYNKHQLNLSCALYFTIDNIHATVSFFNILENPNSDNKILSVRVLNVYFTPEYQHTEASKEQFEKKLNESLETGKTIRVNERGNIIYNSHEQLPYDVRIPDIFLASDCPMIIICNGKYTTPYSNILEMDVKFPTGENNYYSNNSIILFSPIFKEKNGNYEKPSKDSSCVSLSFTGKKPVKQSLWSRVANIVGIKGGADIRDEKNNKKKYLKYKKKYLILKNKNLTL